MDKTIKIQLIISILLLVSILIGVYYYNSGTTEPQPASNTSTSSSSSVRYINGKLKHTTDCLSIDSNENMRVKTMIDCSLSNNWLYAGEKDEIKSGNLCLNLPYRNTANGTLVDVYQCNGDNSQKWYPNPSNKTIQYMGDMNKCLSRFKNTGSIGIWDCSFDDPTQKFEW